jgi:Uma2 family endonuclease
MTHVGHIQTLYEALEALPEGVVGEIINGQLYAHPRPAGPHALTTSRIGVYLGGPYDLGHGGPGGWWIIYEPEVHFVLNVELVVPDLAGWRRSRMPQVPDDQRFNVVPDWVCEVLSPSTASRDREVKMPLYARYGVPYAWLVDPIARRLEAFALDDGQWVEVASFGDAEPICAPPFEEVTLASPWS